MVIYFYNTERSSLLGRSEIECYNIFPVSLGNKIKPKLSEVNLILVEPDFDYESGELFLHELKVLYESTPIIFIANKLCTYHLVLAVRENVCDYVFFPDDKKRLIEKIKHFSGLNVVENSRGDEVSGVNEEKLRPQEAAFIRTKEAKKYIENNFCTKIKNETLSKLCNMSQASLLRHFKKEQGTCPSKYINQFRINRAIDNLSKTRLPISEIAHAVGFQDTSYFIKIFKKTTGITPKEFRENTAA